MDAPSGSELSLISHATRSIARTVSGTAWNEDTVDAEIKGMASSMQSVKTR